VHFTRHISNEIITAFVDGELADAVITDVQSHLAVCTRCQQKVKTQRQTAHLLHTLEELPAPAHVHKKRILQRIGAKCNNPMAIGSRSNWTIGELSTYLTVILCVTFLLVYGVQSLYADVIARATPTLESEVASYVERHQNLENFYEVLSYP
jgi:anti-sigma factor RsiW